MVKVFPRSRPIESSPSIGNVAPSRGPDMARSLALIRFRNYTGQTVVRVENGIVCLHVLTNPGAKELHASWPKLYWNDAPRLWYLNPGEGAISEGPLVMFESYGVSDVGCVRSENQDRILIDHSAGLFMVADGM